MMRTMPYFGRTALGLLTAALLPVSANAVQLGHNGTGQVLLFAYYSARSAGSGASGDYNTLLSIANTTADFKAVKVRFREARTGDEVNELNVFLSPNDSWVAAVIPTATGARLVSNDNSCVSPADFFTAPGHDQFRVAAGSSATADSVREGYIEVIEMGTVLSPVVRGNLARNAALAPVNCAAVGALDPAIGTAPNVFPGDLLGAPTGGLAGRATLLNPATGINFSYVPAALDAWSNAVRYGGVRSGAPLLGAAAPAESRIVLSDGRVMRSIWANGLDAVSATLMSVQVTNEYILDTDTASLTDWVVTFPTRREHRGLENSRPFASPAAADSGCEISGGDGRDFSPFNIANREGFFPICNFIQIGGIPRCRPFNLKHCAATNTFAFGDRGLLNSASPTIFTFPDLMRAFLKNSSVVAGANTSIPGLRNGPNGVAAMIFDESTQVMTPLSATIDGEPLSQNRFVGIPVISLGMHTYNRAGVVSSYGGVIAPGNRLLLTLPTP